ncbi:MAG: hypothetical protein DI573_11300 [Microbacterium sp.]|uniref:ABC transporter permease n=1 Tax=Microbacterium sp. TaxID=51671 RepID=UPI000DB89948|nr:ABC transporter permease subunit [Microbacterium sp.]PZU37598.1 MAG: hypothetical protein DI573_11300 [Microbacterium sp.]
MATTHITEAPRASRRPIEPRSFVLPATLIVGLFAAWILVAWAFSGRHVIPFPWELGAQLAADAELIGRNALFTLNNAALGLMWSIIVIIPLAAICFLLPISQPVVMIVAIVLNVIPTVAIAPILIAALQPEMARVVVTALFVYFPLLIGVLLGFRSVDDRSLDVITASGGREWARLRFLRLWSALPSIVAALQIAVPAAVLGALIAEFFGSAEGLGALLISAQEMMLVNRVWAIGIFAGVIAALGFGLVALLARVVVPWAGRGTSVGTSVAGAQSTPLASWSAIGSALIALVVIIAFWYSLRFAFGLDEYFVKLPHELLVYAFTGDSLRGLGPEAFWGVFLVALGETVIDASTGFIVGIVLAIAGALTLVAVPGLSRVALPLAIVLRSLPILAMLPIVVIVFGRGILTVTIVVVLVSFFPTLVNVMTGLRAAPDGAIDVVRASGGSSFDAARRVRLLYAVPSIIASTQIAVPAAIAGATLAEWLATGNGVGYLLTLSSARAEYLQLWAASIALVIVVLVVYLLLGIVSGWVTRRLGISG